MHRHRHKDNGVFGPSGSIREELVARPSGIYLCASMSISREWLQPDFPASLTRTCTWHNSTLWFGRSTKEQGSSPTKCCDVCRLRGAGYDAYPPINPHAKPYRGRAERKKNPQGPKSGQPGKLLDEKVYKLIRKSVKRRISPTTITTGIASDAPWHTNTAGEEAAAISSGQHALQNAQTTRPTATSSSPISLEAGKSGSRPFYGFARNTG